MWLIAITWMFAFYENVLRVSDSVIIPQLMQDLHIQAEGIGAISSATYFAYVIFLIPAGLILDRYPLKWVLSIAISILTLGCFLFGISHSAEFSWAAQLIMGIGSAFGFPACVKTLHQHLEIKNLSFWIGVIMTVITLGNVCGQAPWYWLVQAAGSWRSAYFIATGFGVLLLIAVLISVNPAVNRHQQQQLRGSSVHKLMRTWMFWVLVLFISLLTVPITGFIGLWALPFISQVWSVNIATAASLAALSWIGGLLGGPLLGYLADYFNIRYRLLLIVGLLTVAILFLIIFWKMPLILLAILLFVLGVFCNANVIIFAILAEKVDQVAVGVTTAIATVFDMGSGPIFQIIIGVLLTKKVVSGYYPTSAFQHAFIWMPIGLLIMSLLILTLKRRTNLP